MSENKKTLRPSSRPMGTIYPKKIQRVLHGEDVKDIKIYKTEYNTDSNIVRKIGDTWINKDGKTVEQMDGWIYIHPKNETIVMPWFCPKCGKILKSNADKKMWNLYEMCSTCVAKMETQLKLTGKWEEYENKKVRQNQLSYYKEVKAQLEDYINTGIKKEVDYHNEDGSTEKWKNEQYEYQLEFFKNELKETTEFIEKLEMLLSGEKTEEELFPEIIEKKEENVTTS